MRKNVTRGFFIPALCAGLLITGAARAQAEESGKESGLATGMGHR